MPIGLGEDGFHEYMPSKQILRESRQCSVDSNMVLCIGGLKRPRLQFDLPFEKLHGTASDPDAVPAVLAP